MGRAIDETAAYADAGPRRGIGIAHVQSLGPIEAGESDRGTFSNLFKLGDADATAANTNTHNCYALPSFQLLYMLSLDWDWVQS